MQSDRDGGAWTALALLAATLPQVWLAAAFAPVQAEIAAGFGAGADSVRMTQNALTLPSLFVALAAPVAGLLADRWGRRPVLAASLVACAVIGPTGLWTSSLGVLLASRALLGVATAGCATAVVTLIGDLYAGGRRLRVMGWQSATLEFGGAATTGVAATLAAAVSWRAPFAIYLLGMPVAVLVLLTVREPDAAGRAAARGLLPPLGPVRLRGIAATYALTFVGMALFFSTLVHMPFLMADLGLGPGATGAVLGTSALSAAAAALLLHRAVGKIGIGETVTAAVALISAGYLFFGFGSSITALLVGGVVSGLGVGLFIPGMNALTVNLADAERRGRIVAGLMTCLFLGQFVCPYVSRPVAEALGRPAMFQVLAAVFALLAVVLAALRARIGPAPGARVPGAAAPY